MVVRRRPNRSERSQREERPEKDGDGGRRRRCLWRGIGAERRRRERERQKYRETIQREGETAEPLGQRRRRRRRLRSFDDRSFRWLWVRSGRSTSQQIWSSVECLAQLGLTRSTESTQSTEMFGTDSVRSDDSGRRFG
ncbi:hypothetical protein HanIR_Chr09g0401431 [Helianthus annuus]|nr:hypothetical protein HanIR_Chr09g0401431 [Helianthus annuus]